MLLVMAFDVSVYSPEFYAAARHNLNKTQRYAILNFAVYASFLSAYHCLLISTELIVIYLIDHCSCLEDPVLQKLWVTNKVRLSPRLWWSMFSILLTHIERNIFLDLAKLVSGDADFTVSSIGRKFYWNLQEQGKLNSTEKRAQLNVAHKHFYNILEGVEEQRLPFHSFTDLYQVPSFV